MQAAPPVPPAAALTATPLTSLGAGVRWGTLGLGLVLAAISGQTTLVVAAWALALAAIALWQSEEGNGSDQPPRLTGATEVAVEVAAVVTTGGWGSPFLFCLLAGAMTVGFSRGVATAARTALASTAGVPLPYHFSVDVLQGDTLG